MLLKINKIANKNILYKNIQKKKNCFFVFNVENFKDVYILYDIFMGNILHSKQLINFFNIGIIKNELFAGNTFFCFIEFSSFFKVFFDLFFLQFDKYKLDLIGICYNNSFLNFNTNYFNLVNCLFLNINIIYLLLFIYVNLFLFKIVLLINQFSLLKKKC